MGLQHTTNTAPSWSTNKQRDKIVNTSGISSSDTSDPKSQLSEHFTPNTGCSSQCGFICRSLRFGGGRKKIRLSVLGPTGNHTDIELNSLCN